MGYFKLFPWTHICTCQCCLWSRLFLNIDYVLRTARWLMLGTCTLLVHEWSWRRRVSRQTAAVSQAQLQPNTSNTDTPQEYPEVHVWVMELQSSLWPLTSICPSLAEEFLHVVLWDGIQYSYRYSLFSVTFSQRNDVYTTNLFFQMQFCCLDNGWGNATDLYNTQTVGMWAG